MRIHLFSRAGGRVARCSAGDGVSRIVVASCCRSRQKDKVLAPSELIIRPNHNVGLSSKLPWRISSSQHLSILQLSVY